MLLLRSDSSRGLLPLIRLVRSVSSVPKPPPLASLANQDDMRQARDWLAAFERVSADDWPKHLTEASFSRSSGPGGQHVNRTFSKATVRLPLPSPSLVPPYALPHLRHSPHYVPSALLVSASTQRTQATNLSEALGKLKAAILDAAKRDLVGETSQAQMDRVRALVAKEKRKVEQVKKQRKDVKGGRGKVRGWE
ncbi:hypothetical protein JCM10450v2_004003 [Rhodotorula kratochvilovae]